MATVEELDTLAHNLGKMCNIDTDETRYILRSPTNFSIQEQANALTGFKLRQEVPTETPSGSSCPLLGLPNEILYTITSYLSKPTPTISRPWLRSEVSSQRLKHLRAFIAATDAFSVLRLAQTCKALRNLALPEFWKQTTFTVDELPGLRSLELFHKLKINHEALLAYRPLVNHSQGNTPLSNVVLSSDLVPLIQHLDIASGALNNFELMAVHWPTDEIELPSTEELEKVLGDDHGLAMILASHDYRTERRKLRDRRRSRCHRGVRSITIRCNEGDSAGSSSLVREVNNISVNRGGGLTIPTEVQVRHLWGMLVQFFPALERVEIKRTKLSSWRVSDGFERGPDGELGKEIFCRSKEARVVFRHLFWPLDVVGGEFKMGTGAGGGLHHFHAGSEEGDIGKANRRIKEHDQMVLGVINELIVQRKSQKEVSANESQAT